MRVFRFKFSEPALYRHELPAQKTAKVRLDGREERPTQPGWKNS